MPYPKLKYHISRILPFGIIWVLLSWVFLTVEYLAVATPADVPEEAIKLNPEIFLFANFAVFLVGLTIGAIESLFLNKALQRKSFAMAFLLKLTFYALFLFLIISITFPIAASLEMDKSLTDVLIWNRYLDFLQSRTFLSTAIQMMVSLAACILYAEISDKIGQRALLDFILGRYHKPRQESRIFMFADMKSSTTIAENLGHIAYFQLLKEYILDLSEAILVHGGDIYQYVGDEIVISWKPGDPKLNSRCIGCFLLMKKILKNNQEKYERLYGCAPDFKAGIHYGEVTTGEIGRLKKELIFTGDTLNTTARIQSLCEKFKTDLIISESLFENVLLPSDLRVISLGKHELRGKSEVMELYALSDKSTG